MRQLRDSALVAAPQTAQLLKISDELKKLTEINTNK